MSTTCSKLSTTSFESQWVTTQYELTTGYIEYQGNHLISADEKQSNDFGFNQEQFSNTTSGEIGISQNYEPSVISLVPMFIMLTH